MTEADLPTAKDNLFGICNALGEDLGVNPLWPRVAFASAFIFDPALVILSYFALGAIILAARLIFPRRRRSRGSAEVVALAPARVEEPIELARAA